MCRSGSVAISATPHSLPKGLPESGCSSFNKNIHRIPIKVDQPGRTGVFA
jgi:hypothetical protein